mgnify:CR=1 FL=1
MRNDLPKHHFLSLLDHASAAVRKKIAEENPDADGAVEIILGDIVDGIRSEARNISADYATARPEVEALFGAGRLGEDEVYDVARERKLEETVVALSLLSRATINIAERALLGGSADIALILAKIAGFSSTTTKALLLLRAADRGMSTHDLDRALASYAQLRVETARCVLSFYQARRNGEDDSMMDRALAAG